jgi:hypothetical protein
LLAVAPAQDSPLGKPAPAIPAGQAVIGKVPEKYAPGAVYVIEFWGSAPEMGLERRAEFDRMVQRYEGKVVAIGVMHGGEDFGFEEVRDHYQATLKECAHGYVWDEDAKLHGSWPIGEEDEPPHTFVVDGKGRLVWSGGFGFVDLVLPKVIAGDADPAALAKATDDLMKRVLAVYLAASLKPEKLFEPLDKLLADHPFLACSLLSDLYGTLLSEGHRELALKLAKRAVDAAITAADPDTLNEIAWSIVDPMSEQDSRDLELADRAAKAAVELTKEKDADKLDTYARVAFWQKDYALAVARQQKAIDVSDDDDQKEEFGVTLAEYKNLAAKK